MNPDLNVSSSSRLPLAPHTFEGWCLFCLTALGAILLGYDRLLGIIGREVLGLGIPYPCHIWLGLYLAVMIAAGLCWRITHRFPSRCIFFLLPPLIFLPFTLNKLFLER